MTDEELEEIVQREAQATGLAPALLREQAKFIIAMEGDEVFRQIANSTLAKRTSDPNPQ